MTDNNSPFRKFSNEAENGGIFMTWRVPGREKPFVCWGTAQIANSRKECDKLHSFGSNDQEEVSIRITECRSTERKKP